MGICHDMTTESSRTLKSSVGTEDPTPDGCESNRPRISEPNLQGNEPDSFPSSFCATTPTKKSPTKKSTPIRERIAEQPSGVGISSLDIRAPLLPPNCVGHRIDALVIAFRCHFYQKPIDIFLKASGDANIHGQAGFRIPLKMLAERDDYLIAHVNKNRTDKIVFQNADLRGVIIPSLGETNAEGPGWSLEITARATWLAQNTIEEIVSEIRLWASTLGMVHEERLRRIDLAADFENWPLLETDGAAFVRAPRSTLTGFTINQDDKQIWGKTYRKASQQITGYTVCPGNPLMMRLYDKTTELSVLNDPIKTEIEQHIWRQNGWNGGTITRLEFQLRGEACKELVQRSVNKAINNTQGLWQYFTENWLRLVTPDTATRLRRCEPDPRWIAAQSVQWTGEPKPLLRSRIRGLATSFQAFGSALTALAQSGRLRDLEEITPESICNELGKLMLDAFKWRFESTEEAQAWLETRTIAAIARNHTTERTRQNEMEQRYPCEFGKEQSSCSDAVRGNQIGHRQGFAETIFEPKGSVKKRNTNIWFDCSYRSYRTMALVPLMAAIECDANQTFDANPILRGRNMFEVNWTWLHNGTEYNPRIQGLMHGQNGVYVVRLRETGEILYVGESHTGRLWKTMLRHFQGIESGKFADLSEWIWSDPTIVDVRAWITKTGEEAQRLEKIKEALYRPTQLKLETDYDHRKLREELKDEQEEAPF
jgi:hypothetical protein